MNREFKVIREFTPIFDRILIKRDDASLTKKMTDAKLIIPDTVKAQYQSSEGVLVKCGDDCCEGIKKLIGERVLFAKFSGEDMIINGEEYVLMSEGDIFGKVER